MIAPHIFRFFFPERINELTIHLMNQLLLTEFPGAPIVAYQSSPCFGPAFQASPIQHPYSEGSSLRGLPSPLIINKGLECQVPKADTKNGIPPLLHLA